MHRALRPLVALAMTATIALPLGAAAVSAPTEPAAPPPVTNDARLLQSMWAAVLTLPVPENPYTGGDPCIRHAGVVGAFGSGEEDYRCDATLGTPVFVNAWSWECSTAETGGSGARYPAGNPGPLRRCATSANDDIDPPRLTVDGERVALTRVTSPVIAVRMPDAPIVGRAGQMVYSVADGWVATLPSLSVGRHEIRLRVTGTGPDGEPVDVSNLTVIRVTRPS